MPFLFNVAKGRVVELVTRVSGNDPSNSGIVVVAINTSADDATLEDLDTLAAVLADGDTAEVAGTGYVRAVLTDSDVSTPTPDDGADEFPVELPNVSFTVAGDDVDPTHVVVCYDPDTTGGDDSSVVPLSAHEWTPEFDGSTTVVIFP